MTFYFDMNEEYMEEQYIFRVCIRRKNKQTRQKDKGVTNKTTEKKTSCIMNMHTFINMYSHEIRLELKYYLDS